MSDIASIEVRLAVHEEIFTSLWMVHQRQSSRTVFLNLLLSNEFRSNSLSILFSEFSLSNMFSSASTDCKTRWGIWMYCDLVLSLYRWRKLPPWKCPLLGSVRYSLVRPLLGSAPYSEVPFTWKWPLLWNAPYFRLQGTVLSGCD